MHVAPTLYDGELKPAALAAFLEANAGPEPEAGMGADDEPLFETIDQSNFAGTVQASDDVWLLVS